MDLLSVQRMFDLRNALWDIKLDDDCSNKSQSQCEGLCEYKSKGLFGWSSTCEAKNIKDIILEAFCQPGTEGSRSELREIIDKYYDLPEEVQDQIKQEGLSAASICDIFRSQVLDDYRLEKNLLVQTEISQDVATAALKMAYDFKSILDPNEHKLQKKTMLIELVETFLEKFTTKKTLVGITAVALVGLLIYHRESISPTYESLANTVSAYFNNFVSVLKVNKEVKQAFETATQVNSTASPEVVLKALNETLSKVSNSKPFADYTPLMPLTKFGNQGSPANIYSFVDKANDWYENPILNSDNDSWTTLQNLSEKVANFFTVNKDQVSTYLSKGSEEVLQGYSVPSDKPSESFIESFTNILFDSAAENDAGQFVDPLIPKVPALIENLAKNGDKSSSVDFVASELQNFFSSFNSSFTEEGVFFYETSTSSYLPNLESFLFSKSIPEIPSDAVADFLSQIRKGIETNFSEASDLQKLLEWIDLIKATSSSVPELVKEGVPLDQAIAYVKAPLQVGKTIAIEIIKNRIDVGVNSAEFFDFIPTVNKVGATAAEYFTDESSMKLSLEQASYLNSIKKFNAELRLPLNLTEKLSRATSVLHRKFKYNKENIRTLYNYVTQYENRETYNFDDPDSFTQTLRGYLYSIRMTTPLEMKAIPTTNFSSDPVIFQESIDSLNSAAQIFIETRLTYQAYIPAIVEKIKALNDKGLLLSELPLEELNDLIREEKIISSYVPIFKRLSMELSTTTYEFSLLGKVMKATEFAAITYIKLFDMTWEYFEVAFKALLTGIFYIGFLLDQKVSSIYNFFTVFAYDFFQLIKGEVNWEEQFKVDSDNGNPLKLVEMTKIFWTTLMEKYSAGEITNTTPSLRVSEILTNSVDISDPVYEKLVEPAITAFFNNPSIGGNKVLTEIDQVVAQPSFFRQHYDNFLSFTEKYVTKPFKKLLEFLGFRGWKTIFGLAFNTLIPLAITYFTGGTIGLASIAAIFQRMIISKMSTIVIDKIFERYDVERPWLKKAIEIGGGMILNLTVPQLITDELIGLTFSSKTVDAFKTVGIYAVDEYGKNVLIWGTSSAVMFVCGKIVSKKYSATLKSASELIGKVLRKTVYQRKPDLLDIEKRNLIKAVRKYVKLPADDPGAGLRAVIAQFQGPKEFSYRLLAQKLANFGLGPQENNCPFHQKSDYFASNFTLLLANDDLLPEVSMQMILDSLFLDPFGNIRLNFFDKNNAEELLKHPKIGALIIRKLSQFLENTTEISKEYLKYQIVVNRNSYRALRKLKALGLIKNDDDRPTAAILDEAKDRFGSLMAEKKPFYHRGATREFQKKLPLLKLSGGTKMDVYEQTICWTELKRHRRSIFRLQVILNYKQPFWSNFGFFGPVDYREFGKVDNSITAELCAVPYLTSLDQKEYFKSILGIRDNRILSFYKTFFGKGLVEALNFWKSKGGKPQDEFVMNFLINYDNVRRSGFEEFSTENPLPNSNLFDTIKKRENLPIQNMVPREWTKVITAANGNIALFDFYMNLVTKQRKWVDFLITQEYFWIPEMKVYLYFLKKLQGYSFLEDRTIEELKIQAITEQKKNFVLLSGELEDWDRLIKLATKQDKMFHPWECAPY